MAFPPLPASAEDKDKDHLLLLSIFHFILAGLSVLGIGFLMLHYSMMSMILNNPEMEQQMRQQQQSQPMPFDPRQFLQLFRWFYVFIGMWGVLSIVLNLIAGFMLRAGTSRIFIFVVACFNCVNMPFGTVLGIFTLLVLTRDSVRQRFAAAATARV